MDRNELCMMDTALKRLNNNPSSSVIHDEYQGFETHLAEKWYVKNNRNIKICSICSGRVCKLEITEFPFIPCPEGTGEIIAVRENDRICYNFDMERFFIHLCSSLNLPPNDIKNVGGCYVVGKVEHYQDTWDVLFSFSRNLTWLFGNYVIELSQHFSSAFKLVIVDEVPPLDKFQASVLLQMGIYLMAWRNVSKDTIQQIYETHSNDLQIRRDLMKAGIQDNSMLVSALRRAATTADGDGFEEEVFNVCRWLFQRIIPFGKEYKGFAIPDGLITDTRENPMPLLFYDCKSFQGEEFKHKAQTPMQVNYYEDFINKFLKNESYINKGFIIFSSDFPDKVQSSITESAQWKFVQGKCKLFFINVEGLERAKQLIEMYGDNASFDSHVFLDICFHENLYQDIDSNSVLHEYYQKLFPALAYSAFRFLSAMQMEIGIIAGYLSGHYRLQDKMAGLEQKLKRAVQLAKHGNQLKKRIKRPTASILLKKIIDNITSGKEIEFHPLSTLLILNYHEEDLMFSCGEERFIEEQVKAIEKLNALLV